MEFDDWQRFDGFGPNPFAPFRIAEPCAEIQGRTTDELRARLVAVCPDVPGVYGMVDDSDRLIYVGKSKQLRTRLRSYFSPQAAQEKSGRIVRHARRIVWEIAPSEFAALLRELQLIRRFQPQWNVQGQPSRRRPSYICIGRGPAEHVYLTAHPAAGATCFGPIYATRQARLAAEILNTYLGLRDCSLAQPMQFSDDRELFDTEARPGCLRYELKTCLGPCVAGCSRAAYYRQVRRAAEFLSGRSTTVIEALRDKMQLAAAARQFERAARLRDGIASLEWLDERLNRLRLARAGFSFVYPIADGKSRTVWYLITGGQVVGALRSPRGRRAATSALKKLDQWRTRSVTLGSFSEASLLLVVAWFSKHPAELQATLSYEQAVQHCRARIEACSSLLAPSGRN